MSSSNVIVRTSIKRGKLSAVTFNPDKRFKGGLPLTEGLCGGKLSVRKRGRGCENSAKIKGALTSGWFVQGLLPIPQEIL